ncbi:hypothetical protein [Pelomonas sp. SE-A7]|uniref:hypothetical protein n=1 Tax=Pelomonas sp. SE-A7 TaxID=3054953 RepID=UPI00259CA45D|nr:hypothetical protein [Pelomonas sp. SE-A7]MDM4765243.1 hypothetical protein [Pelomonas sp. SE-A7]
MTETSNSLSKICKPTLDELASSPTFSMSRGAKELFHTNFIAFVLELPPAQRTAELQAARTRLLARLFGPNPPDEVWVWREHSNLDLVILAAPGVDKPDGAVMKLMDGTLLTAYKTKGDRLASQAGRAPLVIIEAKFKSLPTAEQLRGYDKKLRKGIDLELDEIRVDSETYPGDLRLTKFHVQLSGDPTTHSKDAPYALLRAYGTKGDDAGQRTFAAAHCNIKRILLAPSHGETAVPDTDWDLLPWSELVAALKIQEAVLPGPGDRGLVLAKRLTPCLVQEYCQSTERLLALRDRVVDRMNRFFSPDGECLSALCDDLSLGFHAYRLHDLVGKLGFSLLSQRLFDEANRELKQQIAHLRTNGWTLVHQAFMTRAKPGLNIEFISTTDEEADLDSPKTQVLRVGVQVQECVYRHFVSVLKPLKHPEPLAAVVELLGRREDEMPSEWWQVRALDKPADEQGEASLEPARAGKFDDKAFLYTHRDAHDLSYERLRAAILDSLMQAIGLLQPETKFREQAIALLN